MYDVIHFEALGMEAIHLENETRKAMENKGLPPHFSYLLTPDTVQAYLEKHAVSTLPGIVTVKTHSVLPSSYLEGEKKNVVIRGVGYDHMEHLFHKANITALRQYCMRAVAQTAMKFLFAAAGELNHYTVNAQTFERKNARSFRELGPHVVVTVFGVGKIGKGVHDMVASTGVSMQAVDMRQEELAALYGGGIRFVSKEEAIKNSDIIINTMSLTRDPASRFYNIGYFSEAYLSKAKPGLIFINMSRGDIAPETVLLSLYEKNIIHGLGLDVFTDEGEFARVLNGQEARLPDHIAAKKLVKMALDRSGNIHVQPHQAFNSDIAANNKARESIERVVEWHKNGSFEEQLPYL
jgi:D-lactate dehydrogenase